LRPTAQRTALQPGAKNATPAAELAYISDYPNRLATPSLLDVPAPVSQENLSVLRRQTYATLVLLDGAGKVVF